MYIHGEQDLSMFQPAQSELEMLFTDIWWAWTHPNQQRELSELPSISHGERRQYSELDVVEARHITGDVEAQKLTLQVRTPDMKSYSATRCVLAHTVLDLDHPELTVSHGLLFQSYKDGGRVVYRLHKFPAVIMPIDDSTNAEEIPFDKFEEEYYDRLSVVVPNDLLTLSGIARALNETIA